MLDADPRSCSWGGRLPLRRVASLMTVRGWAGSWFPIVPEPGLAVLDDVVIWRPQGPRGFIAALIRRAAGCAVLRGRPHGDVRAQLVANRETSCYVQFPM